MIPAVVAGAVLGVFSKVVNAVAPAWTGNSLALWLLVAALVGMGAATSRSAAMRGCVSLVVANCAYYAWRLWIADDIGTRFAGRAFAFWTALAIPAGLTAGGVAPRGREAWAVPAGGFVGEAGVVFLQGGRTAHVLTATVAALAIGALTKWTPWSGGMAAGAAVAVGGAVALRHVVL